MTVRPYGQCGSSPRLWGTLEAYYEDADEMRFIPTPVGNTITVGIASIIWSVHPHACGEHKRATGTVSAAGGSSPRLWGTRKSKRFAGPGSRFIPTPVGNTRSCPRRGISAPVHPHACGEHCVIQAPKKGYAGSSPRLWGTLWSAASICVFPRFIPTPVGNTLGRSHAHVQGAVHPHACGEHLVSMIITAVAAGSSPRLWGTLPRSGTVMIWTRFIPTPVGNTPPHRQDLPGLPVHPHACGEHNVRRGMDDDSTGSSPRLWGTPLLLVSTTSQSRFIPTPVGNTCRTRHMPTQRAVHPHACGEHQGKQSGTIHGRGSSPRLWGTHHRGGIPELAQRFIPTPVGNTPHVTELISPIAVHPHACGEHILVSIYTLLNLGSSPRLWGTPR